MNENRKRLKQLLPLIQEYVNGKTIEYNNGSGRWIEAENCKFNSHGEYRLKLKPRKFFIEISDNGIIMDCVRSDEQLRPLSTSEVIAVIEDIR